MIECKYCHQPIRKVSVSDERVCWLHIHSNDEFCYPEMVATPKEA